MTRILKYFKNKKIIRGLGSSKHDPKDALILSSETRSGSTWLMELITRSGVNPVWEPLHPGKGVWDSGEYAFGRRLTIPEEQIDQGYLDQMEDILAGRRWNEWCIKSMPAKILDPEAQLFYKFVRISPAIPWVIQNFQLNFPPIQLIRHPFSVVASQVSNFNGNVNFNTNWIRNIKYQEIYKPHLSYLDSLHTPEEFNLALWCIHHGPIRSFVRENRSDAKLEIVFYEDLVMEPEKELARIRQLWDLREPIEYNFGKPSRSDFKQDFKKDPEAQLSKWKTQFKSDKLESFQKILDHFEMDWYSQNSPRPIIK